MRRTRTLLLALLVGSSPHLATAQILGTGVTPVTEIGPNLAQSTSTAIRSLISNANEITMINQQLQQLANEARELASLPLSLVNEIDQAIRTYNDLLTTGRGMAYILQQSVSQFDELYSGNGDIMQRATRMMAQMREAGRLASMATSVYTRLCEQQARVGKLLAGSQGAIGNLQATQSGNQIMGVIAEQQISIQQILATEQRLQISESMRQLVMDEQAYANAQRFVGSAVVVPITGPGDNNGFVLPR